jgi:hypothetical protein
MNIVDYEATRDDPAGARQLVEVLNLHSATKQAELPSFDQAFFCSHDTQLAFCARRRLHLNLQR